MFNAGFVEASSDQLTFEITGESNLDSIDATSEYTALGSHPEDSDEEDEAYDPGEADGDSPNSDAEPEDVFEMPRDLSEPGISVEAEEPADGGDNHEGEDGKSRNVRQKIVHPSSPRATDAQIIPRGAAPVEREAPGPPKLRVVVKDVAYATYRAVLYYVFPFSFLILAPFDYIVSSCIRIVSASRRCPHPSSHRLRLEPVARRQQTIVRVALVPSPAPGWQKYKRVLAREENGSKIGYAETLGTPYLARQRPCTDLRTVSNYPGRLLDSEADANVLFCRAWTYGTENSGV